MPKIVQTTEQLHSFLMIARLCSKSFKLDFNSMWTKNFHMFNLDLEKAEETKIKFLTSIGSWKNQGSSRKNIYFCFIDYTKTWIVCISQNCVKLLKRWEYQTTLPVS